MTPSLTARTTGRGSVAGGGLGHVRPLSCPVNGVRCESTAGVDVGSTAENMSVDAERPA
jgi:hypothetical protein